MRKKEVTLKTIGEFGLIEQIIKKIGPTNKILHGGIGDDVAVIKTNSKKWLLATCDCQLEDRHFKKTWIDAKTLGRKAALVNTSDIASVGGYPQYALISLGLPNQTRLNFVEKLYDGLKEELSKAGSLIVGGNITSSPKIFIDVFLIGEVKAGLAILRSGARVGNYLLVTGTLGDARAGLEILSLCHPEPFEFTQGKLREGSSANARTKAVKNHTGSSASWRINTNRGRGFLIKKFLLPPSRLKFGQLLAEKKLASSMIDLSDGLSSDLTRICQASQVGVELFSEKIPISKELKKYLSNQDRLENSVPGTERTFALSGGEDYELLFTAHQKNLEKIKTLAKKTKTKITIIGQIKPLKFGRKIVDKKGKKEDLSHTGWDHFKTPPPLGTSIK